jgi:hypothetical protein
MVNTKKIIGKCRKESRRSQNETLEKLIKDL